MNTPIGVIGLGLLGSAIAERLLGAGYQIQVHNRTREKADRLVELGAVWSDNPLAECDRVIISLYTSDVVSSVLEQLENGLHEGQILIDTTTGTPAHAESLALRLEAQGVHYLDAPVSGSSDQAKQGKITVLVGGTMKAFNDVKDMLERLAEKTIYVGGSGNGARLKLVSNLVLGLNRAVLAEGLALGEAMGLNAELTLSVLKASAAYSGVMDTKGRKMINRDFATQARLSQHLKDVRLILEQGLKLDQELPLSKLHAFLLSELEQRGMGDLDNSAIIQAWLREQ
jgi:3-hydroxyisobutyrate dehydrogenase-like beta-hydroxyacid dehydrogenase